MTSFIAAGGSGRSTSVIPAVPAASSVTTIAFIQDLPVAGPFMPPADGRSRPPSAPRHRHRSFPHRRIFPDSVPGRPGHLSGMRIAACAPAARLFTGQPHMPAILSDLGRGGDVEWRTQYSPEGGRWIWALT